MTDLCICNNYSNRERECDQNRSISWGLSRIETTTAVCESWLFQSKLRINRERTRDHARAVLSNTLKRSTASKNTGADELAKQPGVQFIAITCSIFRSRCSRTSSAARLAGHLARGNRRGLCTALVTAQAKSAVQFNVTARDPYWVACLAPSFQQAAAAAVARKQSAARHDRRSARSAADQAAEPNLHKCGSSGYANEEEMKERRTRHRARHASKHRRAHS